MRYAINLGVHRGLLYTNSGDDTSFYLSKMSLPDGTSVTINRKVMGYNWVKLNEDSNDFWYPIDLLVPMSKTKCILERL
ncbi:MAG: hypothetical protein JHC33_06145 [Ignisphaera sp.]|jgi:hypothetical protein|nr:hypothetical protein [Ignisphaera sp.]